MKTYAIACALAIYIALVLGLGVPKFVSAQDDIMVAIGFVWLLSLPPTIYIFLRKIFNVGKQAKEE